MRALIRRWWPSSENPPALRCQEDGPDLCEMSCVIRGVSRSEQVEREWFVDLLWRAFPEARRENWSERRLAEEVATVLSRKGRPVSTRAVQYWLRCETPPHFRYVLAVLALVGAEAVFEVMDPEARR